ncbi:MAG: hypothetical protein E6Q97_09445 [Desulfurellales bacterium]|nr:MAG: hypothetical protein E6Q97_09445 [Desulfurellales bacterium]
MTLATLPRIHGERYRAVKDSVRRRCADYSLCADAVTQCVDRAAKTLREGRSASIAITEGLALAKRLAGWRGRQPESAA